MNVWERIAGWVFDHRGLTGLLLAAVTALAAVGGLRVGVDNSVEIWFLDDDPALIAWKDFQRDFGNDEVVILALHDEDGLLDADGYARIRAVGERAAKVDGIAEVDSIVTVLDIRSGEDWLEIKPVVPEGAVDEDALRKRILDDPLLAGRLVSADGRTALVLAQMESMSDIDARRDAILAELEASVQEPHWSAGIGVVYAAMNHMATVDSAVFMAGCYVVISVLLVVLLGRLVPAVVTLVCVGVSATWLMGLMGLMDRDINMVTMVMPALVVIIGISDCIHTLGHVAMDGRPGESRRDRVVRGVAFMLRPCLFNTLTSSAGFFSLLAAPMPVIRDLGLFSGLGLLGAFVASMLGCTIALAWESAEPSVMAESRVDRFVSGIAEIGIRKPIPVLVVAAFLTLLSGAGIARLEVDTYTIDFLYPDHPVRQDSDRIEEHFGPYTPLEFVVVAPGRATDPALLAAVDRWSTRVVEDLPEIGWSRSMVDVVKKLEMALGAEHIFRVPTDRAAVEQGLLLYESEPGNDLPSLKLGEDRLRVTFGMKMQSARGMESTLAAIRERAELGEGVELVPAGYLPLYVRMIEYIVSSQIQSFGWAFLVVFGLIGLLFRSGRLAILAVPSNLAPVLFTLGAMGLMGIRLDVATVTIAAIVLGLVVDDTVQFLFRLREDLARLGNHEDALRSALLTCGRSMVITTVVLSLGFAVLGLAHVKSVVYFGLLVSLALVSAMIMDLLVLPALIVLLRPRFD